MSILVAYQGPIAAQAVAVPRLTLVEEIMADSPLAYYRNRNGQGHGGTVPDHSGNNLFLSVWQNITDAPSLIASDPSDPAWRLVAGDNFWTATRWAAFDLAGSLSLSLWLRPTIFADGNERDVVRKGNQYGTYISLGGKLTGFIRSGGFERPTVNGPVLTPGVSHHAGFTYEQATGTLSVYLDGALITAEALFAPGAAVDVSNAVNFVCGAFSDSTHGYDGDLDEVAVYGHLLTPARIHAHYVAGL